MRVRLFVERSPVYYENCAICKTIQQGCFLIYQCSAKRATCHVQDPQAAMLPLSDINIHMQQKAISYFYFFQKQGFFPPKTNATGWCKLCASSFPYYSKINQQLDFLSGVQNYQRLPCTFHL